MRKIDFLLNEYGLSHKNETNKLIHWICVPLIFFSLIGLLWSIPSSYFQQIVPAPFGKFINWGTIALALALIYYLFLSFPLFLGMIIISGLFVWINYLISENPFAPLWLVCIVIFVLAWIGQFYGHKIEGKKPSFFKDLQFLLIGPAWLMSFIFRKIGIRY